MVDRGMVQGVDVSDRCVGVSVHIPGNVLAGNWKAAVLVDDRCEEQHAALLNVFTGQLGGAVADLAALIGEVVAVERVPITFDVVEAKGHQDRGRGGGTAGASLGSNGMPTSLHDSVFSTIPARPPTSARPRASAATAAGTACPTSRCRARTPYRARSGSRPEPMTATVHGSRARRDPALALWAVAGTCWLLLVGLALAALASRTTTACSGRSPRAATRSSCSGRSPAPGW